VDGRKRRGLGGVVIVVRRTAEAWSADRSPQLAAALAYYTLFSIAPILVLATALAGFVYGRSGGGRLLALAARFAGPRIAAVLQQILVSAARPYGGLIATIVGVATVLVGAVGAFSAVQAALDQIWGVEPRPDRGIIALVLDRLPGFLLLLAVGVLLVASLAATAIVSGLVRAIPSAGIPGQVLAAASDSLLFLVVMTLLFALVFKVLPDVHIPWRDVWVGGVVTALLFAVGQLLTGLYLSVVGVGSAYGAAGSLIALLVWLYYSAMTFLFGAEMTRIVAERRGSRIQPATNARLVPRAAGRPQRPVPQ
jgi:membrane protein